MTTDTDQVLRLGVIGCGRIAQVAHLPAIAKSARVRLAAVSDPSPALAQAVSRRYDVPGFTQTDDLLALDLDAVLVAVPDRFHREVGCRALEAGKHVLIEKPAAATSAEAGELLVLADKAGRKLQVGAMRRHDPGIQYARAALAALGAVQTATFWYRLPTVLRASTEAALFPAIAVDESVRAAEAQFKADRQTYLLRTHGAHVFDTVRYLLGDVSQVRAELFIAGADLSSADLPGADLPRADLPRADLPRADLPRADLPRADLPRADLPRADLHWRGSLRAARGPASFEISANIHANYSEGAEVFGEHGQVSIRSFFPFYRRASEVAVFDERSLQWTAPDYGAVDPYERQLDAFARAVTRDEPTDPDASDGVEALRLIEATARSTSDDGRPVAL